MREQRGHGKGKEDAHAAGQHGSAALLVELGVIELHSDKEQIQDQPHRAHVFKRGEGVRGKNMSDMREVAPQHGGTNQNSADNLANHARLSKFAGQPAANQRDGQHNRHLEQQ